MNTCIQCRICTLGYASIHTASVRLYYSWIHRMYVCVRAYRSIVKICAKVCTYSVSRSSRKVRYSARHTCKYASCTSECKSVCMYVWRSLKQQHSVSSEKVSQQQKKYKQTKHSEHRILIFTKIYISITHSIHARIIKYAAAFVTPIISLTTYSPSRSLHYRTPSAATSLT